MRREWRIPEQSSAWLIVEGDALAHHERAQRAALPAAALDRWMRDPVRRDVLMELARLVGTATDPGANACASRSTSSARRMRARVARSRASIALPLDPSGIGRSVVIR